MKMIMMVSDALEQPSHIATPPIIIISIATAQALFSLFRSCLLYTSDAADDP